MKEEGNKREKKGREKIMEKDGRKTQINVKRKK